MCADLHSTTNTTTSDRQFRWVSRLSGTTSLLVPITAAVVFFLVIVDQYYVLDMKNGRNERYFFMAQQLGRAYNVSGRSGMMSFMGGGAILVCWYFSHGYE